MEDIHGIKDKTNTKYKEEVGKKESAESKNQRIKGSK